MTSRSPTRPTKSVPMASQPSPHLAALWPTVRQPLTGAALLGTLANLLTVAAPFATTLAYGALTAGDGMTAPLLIALLALAAYALHTLLWVARARLLVRAGRNLGTALTDRFSEAERADARGPFTSDSVGLTQRYRDLTAVRRFLTSPLVGPLLDTPWLVIYTLGLGLVHAGLGAMALVGLSALLALGAADDLHQDGAFAGSPDAGSPDDSAANSVWGAVGDVTDLMAVGLHFCCVVYQVLLLGVTVVLIQRGDLSPGVAPGVFVLAWAALRTAHRLIAARMELRTVWEAHQRLHTSQPDRARTSRSGGSYGRVADDHDGGGLMFTLHHRVG